MMLPQSNFAVKAGDSAFLLSKSIYQRRQTFFYSPSLLQQRLCLFKTNMSSRQKHIYGMRYHR